MKTRIIVGVSIIGLIGGIIGLFPGKTTASHTDVSQCTYKKFRVTSYYSPVEGQDFYYKSNVIDEKILNGQGIAGASGRRVFNGMIAAPSSYAFGTKIYFPGRGIGQVEDRGGAIVHQGERNQAYDRIDIWAGKGEEGLTRALSFGVQYLDAYVCAPGVIPQQVGFDYSVFPSYDDFFERMLWILRLEPGREDRFVESLQGYLISLGYLEQGNATGKYGRKTKAAVCLFQQRTIGLPATHESCGWFGPQTRNAMKNIVTSKGITPTLNTTTLTTSSAGVVASTLGSTLPQEEFNKLTQQQQFHHHLFTVGEFAQYMFVKPLIKGQPSKEARILQRKLARLGFYKKEEITGINDTYTIGALYEFQKAKGVITGNEDPSVFGFLGPGTRRVLNGL